MLYNSIYIVVNVVAGIKTTTKKKKTQNEIFFYIFVRNFFDKINLIYVQFIGR